MPIDWATPAPINANPAPQSQPAKTSVGQCTPSIGRVNPITSDSATANGVKRHRSNSIAASKSTTIDPAAWPLGKLKSRGLSSHGTICGRGRAQMIFAIVCPVIDSVTVTR